MASFNKVILLGNLTRDPELRYTQSGQAVAKFGMAVNRRYTANGEQRESTCFVDLTAWGRLAEVLNQYASKGRPLLVEGRLEYSQWESDGQKRSKLEVVVENFQFVGGREGASGGGPRGPAQGGRPAAEEEVAGGDFDSVPF